MNNKEDILQAYGTTWAGNGSDQLPTPTLFVHPGVLRAAAAGQQWQRNTAVLRPQPAAQQSRSVGLEEFPIAHGTKFEIRLDIFNLLDTVQFTGVNNHGELQSLTDRTITNLPYDAEGNLTQRNGFGTINGIAPAAHAPARHSPDVLASVG